MAALKDTTPPGGPALNAGTSAPSKQDKPRYYRCDECGANNTMLRKLWRDCYAMSDQTPLLCITCAMSKKTTTYLNNKMQEVDAATYRKELEAGISDQIGWYVPAVPVCNKDLTITTEIESYWSYTAVSPAAVAWWRALPF